MGAKGLVLNHSTIAWEQTSVYFRGVAKEALPPPTRSAQGKLQGRRASSLSLDVTTKHSPVGVGKALLPLKKFSSSFAAALPPTTALQLSTPPSAATPQTQLGMSLIG